MRKLFIVFLIIFLTAISCIRIIPAEPSTNPNMPIVPNKNNKPQAYIDLIQPTATQSGDSVIFKGHGEDTDGAVIGYQWRSNLDGILATTTTFTSSKLSVGGHAIFFKVQDSNGVWSDEASGAVVISTRIVKKPVINSFTAIPAVVNLGNSSILNWNVSDASVVTIDNGIGPVSLIGSRTVSPANNTYYTLTAVNEAGSTTSMVLVEVLSPIIPRINLPSVNFFVANPEVVFYGNSIVLSWNVSNASSILIEPSIGYVGASGNISVTPRISTEFRLTASNSLGYAWKTAQVVVMIR